MSKFVKIEGDDFKSCWINLKYVASVEHSGDSLVVHVAGVTHEITVPEKWGDELKKALDRR